MRIAIPVREGLIEKKAQEATALNLYDTDEDEILSKEVIEVSGEEDIIRKLRESERDTFICLSMGPKMMIDLCEDDIQIVGGVRGNADVAVKQYISGTLEADDLVLDCDGNNCNGDCSKCQ